jgi:hypothetical protein
MINTFILKQNNLLPIIAEEVAKGLATSETVGGSAFVSTPLLYPGGTSVVVRMDQVTDDRFFVTDAGIAHKEAGFLGAGPRLFAPIAREAAARFGVRFDEDAFFEADTTRDDLIAAVTAIANASRTAVERVAYRLAERTDALARESMRERLIETFGKERVKPRWEELGDSHEQHEFSAAVVDGANVSALFEVVTPSPQSANAAVTKFVDVGDRKERPELIAVLSDRPKTPHLKIIGRSAKLIDLHADTQIWRRAALAA